MVLERTGYTTAAWGRNGFLCLVERSWGLPHTIGTSGIPRSGLPFVLIQHPAGPTCPSRLCDEDQAGTGGKVRDRDRPGYRIGNGQKETACSRALSDGLHDVKAAVLERRSQTPASAPDVFSSG